MINSTPLLITLVARFWRKLPMFKRAWRSPSSTRTPSLPDEIARAVGTMIIKKEIIVLLF